MAADTPDDPHSCSLTLADKELPHKVGAAAMPPPSVLTVQLGQCGNQVGAEFFRSMAAAAAHGMDAASSSAQGTAAAMSSRSPFFREGTSPSDTAESEGHEAVARAVMVDMEPKVIQETQSRVQQHSAPSGGGGSGVPLRWRYPAGAQFAKAGGSGNNWAMGYAEHAPGVREPVLELVRREAEQADRLAGLMLMHSLAGGTGSGVGAYFTEQLRDEYPTGWLLNHVVWPYESGEVIVQHYNALLTLASVSQAADGVVYFENEHLHRICGKAHQTKEGSETFEAMNELIARQLAHCLLPATTTAPPPPPPSSSFGAPTDGGGGGGGGCQIYDVIRHSCANPRYKLLNIRMLPQMPGEWQAFTTAKWPPLLRNLHQMVLVDAHLDHRDNFAGFALSPGAAAAGVAASVVGGGGAPGLNKSVSSVVSLRGVGGAGGGASAAAETALLARQLFDGDSRMHSELGGCGGAAATLVTTSAAPVPWLVRGQPAPPPHSKGRLPKPGGGAAAAAAGGGGAATAVGLPSAAVLSNSQSVVRPLEQLLDRAALMLQSRAYLHHYARHGIASHVFDEQIAVLEQILFDYQAL
eukprot:SAG22_NODE_1118_length_5518_cov_1.906994_4_plen_581_part_00